MRPPPCPTLCPYTTLFRSPRLLGGAGAVAGGSWRGRGLLGSEPGVDVVGETHRAGDRARLGEGVGDLLLGGDHRVVERDRLLDRSEEHTSELQSRENLVCR